MITETNAKTKVLTQLERVLNSGTFQGQQRQAHFLRFVVEETLNGRSGDLKEILIGVMVFGKGDSYDPRLDASVRIEAGKLRKRLADYYDGPGRSDPVVLTIPKGAYVPRWSFSPQSERSRLTHLRFHIVPLGLIIMFTIASMHYFITTAATSR